MNRYFLLLPALLVLSVIGFTNCSSAGNCSPANCGGCCGPSGMCITNTVAATCGRLGAACIACTGANTACVGGICSAAGMGGGGGSTGGSGGGTTGGGSGGGSGGGGAPTCTAIDFSQGQSLTATYAEPATGDPNHFGVVGIPSATVTGKFNFVFFEGWYFGNNTTPTFPKTVMLPSPSGATYWQCYDCLTLREACDNMATNCAANYYVQGGSMTITTATRNVAAGTFAATGTNLNFVEWDLTQMGDSAIPNGRCATVATVSLNRSWAVDAGVVDAGTDAGIDAGTDAGIDAGIDAGLADAGDGG